MNTAPRAGRVLPSETDGVGRLTLDPGGTVSLRWTNAWRGLLTLSARDMRVTHPLHVHDYFTISVVDSGQAEIQCRGESYHVGPGSVILISPYEVHQETCLSSGGWSSRAMNPRPATMGRVLGGEFARMLDRLRFLSPVVQDAALADQLDHLFSTLERSPDVIVDGGALDRVRESLKRHLRLFAERGQMLRGRRAAEVVRARIHDASREMPSMAELSRLTGMSRFHLSRTFRDFTGLPPYGYFEQVRIARAKVLLRQGHSLSAVAMALGYSDQSHFHRQFREAAATTPGRYARAVRTVFCARPHSHSIRDPKRYDTLSGSSDRVETKRVESVASSRYHGAFSDSSGAVRHGWLGARSLR